MQMWPLLLNIIEEQDIHKKNCQGYYQENMRGQRGTLRALASIF